MAGSFGYSTESEFQLGKTDKRRLGSSKVVSSKGFQAEQGHENPCYFCVGPPPKGPSRTKNSTESEFRYGEKIRYGRNKTLQSGLRNACVSRQKRQDDGRYGRNKTLQRGFRNCLRF